MILYVIICCYPVGYITIVIHTSQIYIYDIYIYIYIYIRYYFIHYTLRKCYISYSSSYMS